jgi:hypothetical protein
MRMTEHPDEDLALVGLVVWCANCVLRDDLVGVVTQPELEQTVAKLLAIFVRHTSMPYRCSISLIAVPIARRWNGVSSRLIQSSTGMCPVSGSS